MSEIKNNVEDSNNDITHVVFKKEDCEKYLTLEEMSFLEKIQMKISRGREKENKKPINNYYICNTDEPYAESVYQTIITGEINKDKLEIDRNNCF